MVTYTYETIPQRKGEKVLRFEVRQRMVDAPLKVHPETGQPVQRVLSPTVNIITGSSKSSKGRSLPDSCPHQHSGGCCGTGMCEMG
jgi:hypothetical protein